MLVLPWNPSNVVLSAQTSKLCRSRSHRKPLEAIPQSVGVCMLDIESNTTLYASHIQVYDNAILCVSCQNRNR